MEVASVIRGIYAQLPVLEETHRLPHIHPYIGAGFAPADSAFRILAVGINSYLGEADVARCQPEWFSKWIAQRRFTFARTVRKDLDVLAEAVVAAHPTLGYDADACIYVTNAVKRYLPEASGKRARQVERRWFCEGQSMWKEELRALARHHVLPNVVVVFGARAWEPVWSVLAELCSDPDEPAFVAYRPVASSSDVFHRLNIVELAGETGPARLVLLRLNHPAAYGSSWRAEAALAHPEIRSALRL